MDVISRKDAKARGLTLYFTGARCKRGHISARYVSSFRCIDCGREIVRQRYRSLYVATRRDIRRTRKSYRDEWGRANRDREKMYRERQKQKNPDYFKAHYAKTAEARKGESREWYKANAEYALQRQKAYAAKRLADNPDFIRALERKSSSKRRAIEKQVFVEAVDPSIVFDRDKGICGICRGLVERNGRWEIDHVIPISKGGPHSYANVQLSHPSCNRAKGARLPSEIAS